ncbi:MAG: hypothetical protein MJ188_12210, partial [Treponema sp.]|nr:hypothetical protein [Treponema sp.]
NPDKFVEHLYKMKREDVSLPLRIFAAPTVTTVIPFSPNKETQWPPEPNSDLDKRIRASVMADYLYIIS